jgi:mono/diheme cytochrome c family protein
MRKGNVASAGLWCVLALLLACRRDMQDQPRYKPLAASSFFQDGRSARPAVAGTVARGQLDDEALAGDPNSDRLPMPVTAALLDRGEQRYDIYCSPCHDRVGNGQGMVVRRGFQMPPSLHIDRLRQAPAGHVFDVVTNGLGAMPSYASQIPARDRWAIVAYVRALQRSQHASVTDVPQEERSRLETGAPQ